MCSIINLINGSKHLRQSFYLESPFSTSLSLQGEEDYGSITNTNRSFALNVFKGSIPAVQPISNTYTLSLWPVQERKLPGTAGVLEILCPNSEYTP